MSKRMEKVQLLGEFALVVVLALAVIEILILGTVRVAAKADAGAEEPAAARVQQLDYVVVPLASGTEARAEGLAYAPATHNDLDALRGFDGVLTDCTVTYYCCEKRPHVCGGGTGKTATGTDVTAGRSAAVDPSVIPLGADIWVDYGDGILQHYVAEDTGSAVGGAHVDLAVATHDEALELGVQTATVWWAE